LRGWLRCRTRRQGVHSSRIWFIFEIGSGIAALSHPPARITVWSWRNRHCITQALDAIRKRHVCRQFLSRKDGGLQARQASRYGFAAEGFAEKFVFQKSDGIGQAHGRCRSRACRTVVGSSFWIAAVAGAGVFLGRRVAV